MKILLLNPFGGEMQEKERCLQVVREDTEIVFENIADVYPLNYVTYIYYRHRCADAVVQRVLKAQKEDFDAVFICCCYDPGLAESRELVDLPVTAAFEAGSHYTNLICQRYSVIATEYKTVHCYRELAQLYGTDSKLASVRHIGLSARDSYPEKISSKEVVSRTLKVAQECIEKDGAEAILMGCTLQSCPLTVTGNVQSGNTPIIDPVLVGIKFTEFMVEAKQAGIPVLSRFGTWQKPPSDEVQILQKAKDELSQ
ncbi:MAG: aspartate/glutamate racemase family protein [Acidobacteriia bacterium]|jgi:allantoin racemase|nr:aspartate/glutamate racemase family protein [Terriglobia bacterium]